MQNNLSIQDLSEMSPTQRTRELLKIGVAADIMEVGAILQIKLWFNEMDRADQVAFFDVPRVFACFAHSDGIEGIDTITNLTQTLEESELLAFWSKPYRMLTVARAKHSELLLTDFSRLKTAAQAQLLTEPTVLLAFEQIGELHNIVAHINRHLASDQRLAIGNASCNEEVFDANYMIINRTSGRIETMPPAKRPITLRGDGYGQFQPIRT